MSNVPRPMPHDPRRPQQPGPPLPPHQPGPPPQRRPAGFPPPPNAPSSGAPRWQPAPPHPQPFVPPPHPPPGAEPRAQAGRRIAGSYAERLGRMTGESFNGPGRLDQTPQYRSAKGLVRQRLIELGLSLVLGVPGILLFAELEDTSPWGLAVMVVLMSGLMSMLEYPSLRAALASDVPRPALFRAMMTATGMTALAGSLFLLLMRLFTDTADLAEMAEALASVEGWLAVIAWQAASVVMGYITAMYCVRAAGAASPGEATKHGLIAIPGVVALVGLPMLALLVPHMLGWAGVAAGTAMVVGLALLLRHVTGRTARFVAPPRSL